MESFEDQNLNVKYIILTVHVVRMLSQDVFVEFLSFVKFTHGFVQAGQVV